MNDNWKYPCGCIDKVVKVSKGYECFPQYFCKEHAPKPRYVHRSLKSYTREKHPKDTSGAIPIRENHG